MTPRERFIQEAREVLRRRDTAVVEFASSSDPVALGPLVEPDVQALTALFDACHTEGVRELLGPEEVRHPDQPYVNHREPMVVRNRFRRKLLSNLTNSPEIPDGSSNLSNNGDTNK